jgi:predicted Zn-ribbon and HTH transcriptional regulator
MKNLLTQFTGRSHNTIIAECRQCGMTVEIEMSECPECNHDGISIYRFV